MNKKALLTLGLNVLGVALTLASSFVNGKINDAKMSEMVAERVKEALENRVKESI